MEKNEWATRESKPRCHAVMKLYLIKTLVLTTAPSSSENDFISPYGHRISKIHRMGQDFIKL